MRIFCRLDVAIYLSQRTGKFEGMVNEITRCHFTALFHYWDRNSGELDVLHQEMAKTINFLSCGRLSGWFMSIISMEFSVCTGIDRELMRAICNSKAP